MGQDRHGSATRSAVAIGVYGPTRAEGVRDVSKALDENLRPGI